MFLLPAGVLARQVGARQRVQRELGEVQRVHRGSRPACRPRAGCSSSRPGPARRSVKSWVSTMIVAPLGRSPRLAFSAAGFIATSTSGRSPGVRMSWSAKCSWKDETPASVPCGARISAGKFGKVDRSLPKIAVSWVNRSPVSCMPSPESPAIRMTTRSSCWTFLDIAGGCLPASRRRPLGVRPQRPLTDSTDRTGESRVGLLTGGAAAPDGATRERDPTARTLSRRAQRDQRPQDGGALRGTRCFARGRRRPDCRPHRAADRPAHRGRGQRVQLLQLRQDRAALDAGAAGEPRRSSRRCIGSCASSPRAPASRCRASTSRRPRSPTPSPPAAVRATPPSVPPRASCRSSTSANCAPCSATN